MSATVQTVNKPIPLRVIFILNAIMMVLPFVFYAVITTKGIEIGGIKPISMVYTGLAYIASFGALVFFILKRNIWAVRAMFVINILIALPTSAYIGIVVAIVSMAVSFHGKVRAWFGS